MIFMSMGHIYQIRNVITNAVYIGSVLDRNPQDRWMRHRKDLRGNIHHSQHLQRAWNKYGEQNFVFEILEKVKDNVLKREQWYLDDRKNNHPRRLTYNVCWVAGNCQGRKMKKSTLRKISLANTGRKQTTEAKEKQLHTWAKKCKHPYSFTSPDNVVYNNVRNLRAFAREHNIGSGSSLRKLHQGKLHQVKGWIKTGTKRPFYELHSPDGLCYGGIFLKSLCQKGNVNYKMIHKYCIKYGKPYKGWTANKT